MIKKIAMLSVHTSPIAKLGGQETGGMNVYVKDLSHEFSRQGIDIDIYTRSQDPTLPRITWIDDKVRVIQIKAGPERPYNKNDIYHHLDEFAERVLVHDEFYDIMFAHYWLSGLVGLRLRHVWGTPVVQMFHTLAALKNQIAQTQRELEPPQRINCERELMHRVNHLIAATPIDKHHMLEHYGAPENKISIVPPGVNLQRFQPIDKAVARQQLGIPSEHQMILFVGRIQPLKGIDVLLKALALIKRSDAQLMNDVCLAIIGGDPNTTSEAEQIEMKRLLTLRQQLGLEDMVTFLGSKNHDDLINYYSAAEIVVIPSNYESFGLVAVEAMACGTPVIASDVGGLTFSVADGFNGYLFPVRDAEALAHKIRLVLRHESLQEQLSRQAQTWVERFSWHNIAEELKEVFETVLQS